jgi:hypothetical protein
MIQKLGFLKTVEMAICGDACQKLMGSSFFLPKGDIRTSGLLREEETPRNQATAREYA